MRGEQPFITAAHGQIGQPCGNIHNPRSMGCIHRKKRAPLSETVGELLYVQTLSRIETDLAHRQDPRPFIHRV